MNATMRRERYSTVYLGTSEFWGAEQEKVREKKKARRVSRTGVRSHKKEICTGCLKLFQLRIESVTYRDWGYEDMADVPRSSSQTKGGAAIGRARGIILEIANHGG